MANIEQRLKKLEEDMLTLKKEYRKTLVVQREMKNRLDGLHSMFADLSLRISESLLKSSEQFHQFVQMNNAQTQTSREQADIARAQDKRLWELEFWRQEIVNTRSGIVTIDDQTAVNVSMAKFKLMQGFSHDDLNSLIFDVFGSGVEPADFGKRKEEKVEAMLKTAVQAKRFWRLVKTAQGLRPGGVWPTDTADTGPLE